MERLTEQKLINMMRDAWKTRVDRLAESLSEFMDEGEKRGIIGVDTKVRHEPSQLLYTVVNIGPHDITLQTPTGKEFDVSDEEFESEYVLA